MSESSTTFQQRFLRSRLRAGQSFASVRRPQRLQPQHTYNYFDLSPCWRTKACYLKTIMIRKQNCYLTYIQQTNKNQLHRWTVHSITATPTTTTTTTTAKQLIAGYSKSKRSNFNQQRFIVILLYEVNLFNSNLHFPIVNEKWTFNINLSTSLGVYCDHFHHILCWKKDTFWNMWRNMIINPI